MHGMTGNGFRKAEERVTLAQLYERTPREHPWEVVLDATHRMDVIFRDLRDQVVSGETIGVDQLDRLINFNQIRHHLAKTAIDTKAHEQVSLAFTRHLEMEGEPVATAVAAALDKLGLTEPWRAYALQVAHRALLGDEAQGDEPQPPDDPVVQEYDVGPRNVPAIEAVPSTPVPCDVTVLHDDALRDVGELVLAELAMRDIVG
jgi:hypothetical protein